DTMPQPLTIPKLQSEATAFARVESAYPEPTLYGVTDGKAVGTYLEQKFQAHLKVNYDFALGNSATGIDFPGLGVDIKVTSIRQLSPPALLKAQARKSMAWATRSSSSFT